jgi:hypothetical protein
MGFDSPLFGAGFLVVRPAGRTHSEVEVLYTPGKGKSSNRGRTTIKLLRAEAEIVGSPLSHLPNSARTA